ncbi:MAG: nucleotidyltransferase domain-containing protein [Candidatus Krumholzibacteriota bacterium]|nr:nucleotidyltransferase domain-containing protein [Candidatus Krumholzibacteriota bacterium]
MTHPAGRGMAAGRTAAGALSWSGAAQAWLEPGDAALPLLRRRAALLRPESAPRAAFPDRFWLDACQDDLQRALDLYLNGEFLGWGRRLLGWPMAAPRSGLRRTLDRAWHLAREKLLLLRTGPDTGVPVPEQLAALAGLLAPRLESESDAAPAASLDAIAVWTGGVPVLDRVRDALGDRLAETGSLLLVHGSVADGTATGFSDLDLWLFVSQRALASPPRLAGLARACFGVLRHLYDHDPLQHHGLLVASAADVHRYPGTRLPVAALRRAAVLTPASAPPPVLRPRDASLASAMLLLNTLSWLRDPILARRPLASPFAVKCAVSSVLLLPTHYEGACGRPCYKGDAFARVAPAVPPGVWSIVEDMTHLRAAWRYRPAAPRRWLLAALRNPFLFRAAQARLPEASLAARCGATLPADWRPRSLALAEHLWRRVCESATT